MNCGICPKKADCTELCEAVKVVLPSMETGRVDTEDCMDIVRGRIERTILLDYNHTGVLTGNQKEIIQLYYREGLTQDQIASRLGVTKQAVSDRIVRARARIGKAAIVA